MLNSSEILGYYCWNYPLSKHASFGGSNINSLRRKFSHCSVFCLENFIGLNVTVIITIKSYIYVYIYMYCVCVYVFIYVYTCIVYICNYNCWRADDVQVFLSSSPQATLLHAHHSSLTISVPWVHTFFFILLRQYDIFKATESRLMTWIYSF